MDFLHLRGDNKYSLYDPISFYWVFVTGLSVHLRHRFCSLRLLPSATGRTPHEHLPSQSHLRGQFRREAHAGEGSNFRKRTGRIGWRPSLVERKLSLDTVEASLFLFFLSLSLSLGGKGGRFLSRIMSVALLVNRARIQEFRMFYMFA